MTHHQQRRAALAFAITLLTLSLRSVDAFSVSPMRMHAMSALGASRGRRMGPLQFFFDGSMTGGASMKHRAPSPPRLRRAVPPRTGRTAVAYKNNHVDEYDHILVTQSVETVVRNDVPHVPAERMNPCSEFSSDLLPADIDTPLVLLPCHVTAWAHRPLAPPSLTPPSALTEANKVEVDENPTKISKLFALNEPQSNIVPNHQLLVSKYFFAALACFLSQVPTTELTVGTMFAITFILGTPHGGMDHELYKAFHNNTQNDVIFFTGYLGIAAAITLLWLTSPTIAFGCYMTAASFHLGETQLGYLPRQVPQLLWGLGIVGSIVLTHPSETGTMIDSIVPGANNFLHQSWIAPAALSSIFGTWLVCLFRSCPRVDVAIGEVVETMTLVSLLVQVPALLGFSYVYLFWHLGRSIPRQLGALSAADEDSTFTLAEYCCKSLPYGGVATAMVAAAVCINSLVLVNEPLTWSRLSVLGLTSISAFAVPHVLLHSLEFKSAEDWQTKQ